METKLKLLQKYILKSVLKNLFLILLLLTVLSSFIDSISIIKNVDNLSMNTFLKYNIYSIPYHLNIIAPLSFFLSIMLTVTLFENNNEITAIIVNGISLTRVFYPLFILSIAMFVIFFVNSEFIMPNTYPVMNSIYTGKPLEKQKNIINDFTYPASSETFYRIDSVDIKLKTLKGILIKKNSSIGNLITYKSDTGYYSGSSWILPSVIFRKLNSNGIILDETVIKNYRISEIPGPSEILLLNKIMNLDREEMQITDLIPVLAYSKTLFSLDRKIKVNILSRFTPILHFTLLCLLAIISSLSKKSVRSSVGNIGLGILVYVLFIFFENQGITLGSTGNLNPVLGSTLGDIFLFCVMGFYLLKKKYL